MTKDIIIGVLLFLVVFFFFYGLTQQIAAEREEHSAIESVKKAENDLRQCVQQAEEKEALAHQQLMIIQQLAMDLQEAIGNNGKTK